MATSVGPAVGVSSSASSVTLAEINNKRQALSIYNNSTQILYVNYTSAASIASGGFSVAIPPTGYFELPVAARGVFTGKITGIWAGVNGYANITEFTEGL